jgi:hypothetical protein
MWAVENAGAGHAMQHEDGLPIRVTCFLDSKDSVVRRVNQPLHGTQDTLPPCNVGPPTMPHVIAPRGLDLTMLSARLDSLLERS